MKLIGYEPRVFSVSEASSRSSARVSGSTTTFSSMRAEPSRGRVNLRLRLARELDDLRVATALEIEDAGIAPAMLVVADQAALRIARERRLAGARQTEEERRVAVRADVRRAVHRQHALQRQRVVENREDRLLDLAGVVRAADEHHSSPKFTKTKTSERDPWLAGSLLKLGASMTVNSGRCSTRFSGIVLRQKHVPREEVVPRKLVDDADREPVLAVGARPGVEDVEIFVLQIRHHVLVQRVELGFVHRPVHVAPMDVPFAGRLAHEELVVR